MTRHAMALMLLTFSSARALATDEPEARGVPEGPLEVVEQRPVRVAADIEAVVEAVEDRAQGRVHEPDPLGRIGAPDDVALAALFLASDSSSWLTGLTMDVAGGRVML